VPVSVTAADRSQTPFSSGSKCEVIAVDCATANGDNARNNVLVFAGQLMHSIGRLNPIEKMNPEETR
jgi:hypothetical protein